MKKKNGSEREERKSIEKGSDCKKESANRGLGIRSVCESAGKAFSSSPGRSVSKDLEGEKGKQTYAEVDEEGAWIRRGIFSLQLLDRFQVVDKSQVCHF